MIEMNDFINMFSSADPSQLSTSVKLIILLTILSIAPGILILMTSFTRIIVVLSFVRTSLATQQMPPNQVLIGLALFLPFFIMSPTFAEAYDHARIPIRELMAEHSAQEDLALVSYYTGTENPETLVVISLITFVPAFAVSALKTAFQMGFMISIPFLLIDMAVPSILMS